MTSPAIGPGEKRFWILLMIFTLTIRLIGLEDRALSHDESLHAYYSLNLSRGLNYQHHPMMHGPLLFHLNGAIYALLGVNDFTSRLFPAFWGTAAVGLLFLFRRWLGPPGACAAALLVSLDPGLLYYSRYLRNDIMVVCFTLLMLWAILDYRETRAPRSLLWLGLGLGLQFVSKETSFIVGAVFGSGCVLFAALETQWESFSQALPRFFGHPLMHCALLMLFLALPFACALPFPLMGWDPLDNHTPEGQQRIFIIAGWLFAIALLSGIGYFRRQNRLQAFAEALGLFWIPQILFYTTLLTNPAQGMASGLAGSLGYWLRQHEVQRGNPDPFFYVTLLLLYTPVLIAAALMTLRRFRRRPLPFLWFWLAGSLLIYSWAGERMPWLLLHISLPLCLLAAPPLYEVFASPGKSWLKVILALGCFQLLCNSLRVNGPLAEGPWEPLMFAHSGPDLKTSVLLAGAHLEANPGTAIRMDDRYTWPMIWYFRDLPVEIQKELQPPVDDNFSVLLIPPFREEAFRAEGWIPRLRVDMTTWPRAQYHRISLENLDALIHRPAVRKTFIRYYLFREQPAWGENEWPVPNRYLLMTR